MKFKSLTEAASDFEQDLLNFINNSDKLHNSDIDQKMYDKVLDRFKNGKKTNVRAIKNVNKLVQYYLAANMIGDRDLMYNIHQYVEDCVGFSDRFNFSDLFDQVEHELPELRELRDPRIEYIDNKFYVAEKNGSEKFEAVYAKPNVTYRILDPNPESKLDGNCWSDFENECTAPAGSIRSKNGWNVSGKVILDKTTNTYKVLNVVFSLKVQKSNRYIVARYSGLHNTAWVSSFSLYSERITKCQNRDWNGSAITRGIIYLCKDTYNDYKAVVNSVKGDWDGNYNNISFEKLLQLMDI